MKNTLQHQNWISRMRLTAAGAALALLTVLLSAVVTTPSAQAQTFATLASFDGTDGANPQAALVQATNGSLYGTTESGGTNGDGTVFEISPSGTLTTLHSFDETDGQFPYSAPIQAADGNLYGTTQYGGANGGGTVFKITPSGTLTTLYNFSSCSSQSGCTDGYRPFAGLVEATNGALYGTTGYGGAYGSGNVFKINLSGTLTTLYSFCSQLNCPDGSVPVATLVQDRDTGDLYGTTVNGGTTGGGGTVFKITLDGTLTTIYSGIGTQAGLIQGSDGNFYGTTYGGGANGMGEVFKITCGGELTPLYSFCSQSGCTDGEYPSAGLVQGTDGNFYGTTQYGGVGGSDCFGTCGTVFKVTPTGTLTTLHSFSATDGDGAYPLAAPIQDTNGSFYGTTTGGGADFFGAVFSLSEGLHPFVETQITSGPVGAAVKILGTELTGATSVSFNGTASAFNVISRSLITTTVPAGATTGKVQVVTPSRTLSSNVEFRVTP
jgi:uncharacterized repeat protein (TIGR03803 family)